MENPSMDADPRAGETAIWRVIGAFLIGLIGAGIGVAIAPEFGGDAYSAMVSSLNAMVGAFLGAVFGGGMGWLIDRAIGRSHREQIRRQQIQRRIHQQQIRERQDMGKEEASN
jgi:membrane protein YqaA with SNARE-associated domain